MARLHKVTLANGDLQQSIYRWDGMFSTMRRRPSDEDLMHLFVLELGVNLPTDNGFGIEYLPWYNRTQDDPVRR